NEFDSSEDGSDDEDLMVADVIEDLDSAIPDGDIGISEDEEENHGECFRLVQARTWAGQMNLGVGARYGLAANQGNRPSMQDAVTCVGDLCESNWRRRLAPGTGYSSEGTTSRGAGGKKKDVVSHFFSAERSNDHEATEKHCGKDISKDPSSTQLNRP
ncbi:unnamed protein product, partial [Discosporangium mesarthrocarpum]